MRRRSYSSPNIFVNSASPPQERQKVLVPVARTRAKRSTQFLTVRKQSALRNQVTESSTHFLDLTCVNVSSAASTNAELILSALDTSADDFMAALHIDDKLQLNELEARLREFYTITKQFREALEYGVISTLTEENGTDANLIKLLANVCVVDTCVSGEDYDEINDTPTRTVRTCLHLSYKSKRVDLIMETEDKEIHGSVTGVYSLSTASGKDIWRFGVVENLLSSVHSQPIWDEKRARKVQAEIDLPVSTSTGLFFKYITAIIQMRIEQQIGKQSSDFQIPVCGGHLVDLLSVLLSGPSRKRKRGTKEPKTLTPNGSKTKKRKLL